MIGLVRGVFNRRVDVLPFEEGVVGQNLVKAGTVREKLKYVADTHALPANTGTAPAFTFFDGDSLESVGAHIQLFSTFQDTLLERSLLVN